jgi:tight adherence protein C
VAEQDRFGVRQVTMVLLVPLALACVAGAAWLVATDLVVGRPQRAALGRVRSYGRADAPASERRPARREGPDIVRPLAVLTLRMAPKRDRVRTASQLQAAGIAASRTDAFLALKAGLALGGLGVGVLVAAAGGRVGTGILLGVGVGAVGFVLPDIVVSRRARSRHDQVLRALPNALDLLAVIVEAGLGLDAALSRYAERSSGPLADEISLLVAELRVGTSRAAAFRGFATRVPALETQSFVRAITAADQLGVSLSKTLRTQAREARVRRQLLAEQDANKAPVKMLFPTVLCIFPVLFVVVLAPAVLSLLHL